MLEASTLAVFAVPAFLLLLIPGPAIFAIVARGVSQGRLSALMLVLGVQVGDVLHITATAVGLTTILASSSVLFATIKVAGAAYLLVLGVRTYLVQTRQPVTFVTSRATLWRCFLQGVAVNLLNPGTVLFYFSFLPQFVEPGQGPMALQIAQLGAVSMAIAAVIEGIYAMLAGTIGMRLHGSVRFQRIQSRVSGGIFVLLGVTAAVPGAV